MPIVAAFMVPHPPMIVPEVGRGSESQIEKTIKAYQKVADEIAALKPQTIIISSPHSVMYSDYFHISPGSGAVGSFADFGAPQVKFDIKYDQELVELLSADAEKSGFPAGTLGEKNPSLDHGTMVPLYFILKKYKDFKLVRTGLSGYDLLKHYEYGMMIRDTVEQLGRKVVYVASGDLSHKLQSYGPYGFAEEGPLYDKRIMEVCSAARFGELFDFDESFCEKAAECGHKSFVIMAGALDGQAVEARQYSHEDVTGVGYGICSFVPKGDDESRHFLSARLRQLQTELEQKSQKSDAWVKLARASAEYFVKNGREMKLADCPPEISDNLPSELLNTRAGAFVSIHKFGTLRGCIGTIAPTKENLALEIIHNAVSAVSEDPRFQPVTEDELKYLDINVDVLGEAEKISSPSQLDVKKYGVIVQSGYKRGLLLPDLDGVDTVEKQISIARRKGRIAPDDKVDLFRFEVVRHY
ncbi:MAG: AmmeMemoRadiSam system protein A [Treponema sp.]|nr:AmmeMemoRadiSam system protein A [Treponema sp.]